ncbi:unnamed protein product [Oikopleura dioica]|uniref:Uncharacterized protein n=1 Tax=Oikopleura dioica TaxID=34765 RepID=E4XVY4_OIKDI|nr:unnamed protein product [Oikopleura dioica]
MECDPDFLEGVCCKTRLRSESSEIRISFCKGKPTRIVVYSKTDEDYISSYSENPLDFYETDDFEEVVLPKSTTTVRTTTEKIVTSTEAKKKIPAKDKTLAIVIGIVEGLAFLTLVAVLTVSCYLAKEAKMNGHQHLESVETAPLTQVKEKRSKVSTIDSSI